MADNLDITAYIEHDPQDGDRFYIRVTNSDEPGYYLEYERYVYSNMMRFRGGYDDEHETRYDEATTLPYPLREMDIAFRMLPNFIERVNDAIQAAGDDEAHSIEWLVERSKFVEMPNWFTPYDGPKPPTPEQFDAAKRADDEARAASEAESEE